MRVRDKIEIALTIAQLHVLKAMPFFGKIP